MFLHPVQENLLFRLHSFHPRLLFFPSNAASPRADRERQRARDHAKLKYGENVSRIQFGEPEEIY